MDIRNRPAYLVTEEMENFVAASRNKEGALKEYLRGWDGEEQWNAHVAKLGSKTPFTYRWNVRTGWTTMETLQQCFSGEENAYGEANAYFLAQEAATGFLDGGMRNPFAGVLAAGRQSLIL